MTYNLRYGVHPLETLAGLGMKEYRAWRPVDAVRPAEMIRTAQYRRADLGFCEAVSAGRGVTSDHAMQWIAGVITAGLPEAYGALRIHWDAAKTDHPTPPIQTMEEASMIAIWVSLFPPIAL